MSTVVETPSAGVGTGGVVGSVDPLKRLRRSVGLGTDLSMTDVDRLQTEITDLRKEVIRLEAELNRWRGGATSREVLKNTVSVPRICKTEPNPVPIQLHENISRSHHTVTKPEDELCLAVVFKTEPTHAQIHSGNSGSLPKLENLLPVYKEGLTPRDGDAGAKQKVQTSVTLCSVQPMDCKDVLDLNENLKEEAELWNSRTANNDDNGFIPSSEHQWMSSDVRSTSFQPKEDPNKDIQRNSTNPLLCRIRNEGEKQYSGCLETYDSFTEHRKQSSQASSNQVNPQRIHTGEKLHHCVRCGQFFTTSLGLEGHHREKPDCSTKKTFNCLLCGRSFSQKYRLARHTQIHTGEKPFPCITCGKQFAQASGLKLHQRIHTGEKPFLCTFCGKGFAQSSNRDNHTRTHTGERPFVCLVCGNSFGNQTTLRRHEIVHTGEKSYVCSLCGKHFSREEMLRVHKRIHSGEKPYPCTVCGKAFVMAMKLKVHMRVHTGEKPYSCTTCGKRYAKLESLKKHQKLHEQNC